MIKLLKEKLLQKQDYSMLHEIMEQPEILKKLSERFFDSNFNIKEIDIPVKAFSRICICASGSSKNVGEIIKYFIEKLTCIPVIVEYASEFAHKPICLNEQDLLIAISQSGNTADTFEALKKAKNKNVLTLAITNNAESKIHKLADYKIFLDVGVEKSIAATKSFIAQLFVLYIFGIYLSEKLGNNDTLNIKKMIKELSIKAEEVLEQKTNIKKAAKKIKKAKSIVILGRGINSHITHEGALKIKETSYIDANGYPSGEFLHGHLAFVDKTIPVVSMLNKNISDTDNYKLAIKNTKEIKLKRKPPLIIIKTKEDTLDGNFKNSVLIEVPQVLDELIPFINTICLQLLAYETAISLRRNVDKPRSLKKCVEKE